MRKLCLALFIATIFTILSTSCVSKNDSYTDKTKTPLQNELMQYDYEIAKESNEEIIEFIIVYVLFKLH